MPPVNCNKLFCTVEHGIVPELLICSVVRLDRVGVEVSGEN